MNHVNLRMIGVVATVTALSALLLSAAGPASAAAPFGKNGVISACVKAKGKNRGALRVVAGKRSCQKMRGWRSLSWSLNGSSGTSGQSGSQGVQGNPGPEGKEGQEGAAGQVEESLLETIKTQSTEINGLVQEVTDLSDEVLSLEGDVTNLSGGLAGVEGDVTDLTGGLEGLEGTVGETCTQLTALTTQTDEIVTGVSGVVLNNALQLLGGVVTFPNLPDTLGTFECSS